MNVKRRELGDLFLSMVDTKNINKVNDLCFLTEISTKRMIQCIRCLFWLALGRQWNVHKGENHLRVLPLKHKHIRNTTIDDWSH